ncbi:MAG TPA: response regulator [Myxococcales bacterium]
MPTRVMVVDDDPDILTALSMTLQTEGYGVHACRHGREALDMLEGGLRPAAILLDLMMPVMNGFEFLQVIKSDIRWRRIPVVVLSANRGYSRDDLGVLGMLRKPFELDELFAALAAATEPRQRS